MEPSLVLCKQGVAGSIPATSTNAFDHGAGVPPRLHAELPVPYFSGGLASRPATLERGIQKVRCSRAAL